MRFSCFQVLMVYDQKFKLHDCHVYKLQFHIASDENRGCERLGERQMPDVQLSTNVERSSQQKIWFYIHM